MQMRLSTGLLLSVLLAGSASLVWGQDPGGIVIPSSSVPNPSGPGITANSNVQLLIPPGGLPVGSPNIPGSPGPSVHGVLFERRRHRSPAFTS